jgi:hypothetical protein
LSISEDQQEAVPDGAGQHRGQDDLDGSDLDGSPFDDADLAGDGLAAESRAATSVTKWGTAGLLLVYAGLGSYCVASALGGGGIVAAAGPGGGAHPEGVTRSVAAAMTTPSVSAPGTPKTGTAASGTVAIAKSYAAKGATREAAVTPAVPAPVEVLTAVKAVAIGPDGSGDGDHPKLAPYVLDPHSATSWITHWYASPNFGNLQEGTGLLLDMGKVVTIRQVELALGGSPGMWGANVEIRVGETPDLVGAKPVALAQDVGGWVAPELSVPVTGRYVQIWFTKLPRDAWGTYQEHVYGVTVRGSEPAPPHSAPVPVPAGTGSPSRTTSQTTHPGQASPGGDGAPGPSGNRNHDGHGPGGQASGHPGDHGGSGSHGSGSHGSGSGHGGHGGPGGHGRNGHGGHGR